MKTIIFLLFPVLLWGQPFEVNLAKFDTDDWYRDHLPELINEAAEQTEAVSAMSALEFINRIDKQEYKHDLILDEVSALCPWQSWRLQPYFSYQVDVILSPDEFDAFEPRLLDEDLMYYIYGGNRDALNITERGYFAQIHRPGLIGKLMRDYRFVNPEHALYYKGTPLNGWHIRTLKNGMAIAARDLPNNRIHVSMARFLEYTP